MNARFSTAMALVVGVAAACGGDGSDVLTYDEFKAAAYQEPDTGAYVLNGDELAGVIVPGCPAGAKAGLSLATFSGWHRPGVSSMSTAVRWPFTCTSTGVISAANHPESTALCARRMDSSA